MEENINLLIEKFQNIKNKGYIKSVQKGSGSVGLTLEEALGKKAEKSSNPDYMGIELKAKKSISHNTISLFNLVPDSYKNVIDDIRRKYGYPDKDLSQYNVFNLTISCSEFHYVKGKKYIYTLKIDYQKQKVIFQVYNSTFKLIDETISWSFESIENKLKQKLTYLAIIEAKRKYELQKEYFKYTKMTIYKLKGLEEFLELLEKGKIQITFKIGIYKTKDRYGETYYHGTAFCINENYIKELFQEITTI